MSAVHHCAARDLFVARRAHAQPRHVCTSCAGGRSRDDREGSHERERKRQKEDTTEAKAEDAAATEPKAGVILEVILQPLQQDQAAKACGLK